MSKASAGAATDKATTARRTRAPKVEVVPATPREVRVWAAENGVEVGARGKIKADVIAAFTAATGRPLASE